MLFRKLWRDIRNNYGAYLACCSVVMIGLAIYVSFSIIVDNLNSSLNAYYQEYGFADGYARLTAGPPQLADRLKSVPGLDKATARYVRDVLLHRSSGEDITTLRLISYQQGHQPLNRFRLTAGRLPVPGQRELLVSPAFFKANHFRLGQSIPLIINGREVLFAITGTAISPEFVYEISEKGSMYPNPVTFGVAWVPERSLATLPGFGGMINELAFSLKPGVKFSQVKGPVGKLLEPFGLTAVFSAEDQLSNLIVQQKLDGIEKMARSVPIMFLMIAAAILYIMLRRMVEQQRGQIGILKAFGFGNASIILHYLWYAWLIGLFGGLVGGLLGALLSVSLADLYREYFNIPGFQGGIDYRYLAGGTLLTLFFTSVAGLTGCKNVLRLEPAEAMRPSAPVTARRTPLERLNSIWSHLNTQGKMAVRNIFRNRQRSLLAITGIALAFSMMVAFQALISTVTYLFDFQYNKVELYDLRVGLSQPADRNQAISDAEQLKGVVRAEPLLELGATLEHHWIKKDLAVMGLMPHSTLYRLLDQEGRQQELPAQGLTISTQLARTLKVAPGDIITITFRHNPDTHYQVQVTQIVPQYIGLGAYMDIRSLSKLAGAHDVASAILFKAQPGQLAEVRSQLQNGSKVTTLQDKTTVMEEFQKAMASTGSTMYIMLVFALITGFAIVYNINLISLSERERELATLIVLGMTENEVATILYLEQALLGIVGTLIGIPLSYGLLSLMSTAYSSDLFNMPAILQGSSIVLGVAGTLVFMGAALWKIRGRISSLSMLDVLKAQE